MSQHLPYAYVDGSDLDLVAPALEARFAAFVSGKRWSGRHQVTEPRHPQARSWQCLLLARLYRPGRRRKSSHIWGTPTVPPTCSQRQPVTRCEPARFSRNSETILLLEQIILEQIIADAASHLARDFAFAIIRGTI